MRPSVGLACQPRLPSAPWHPVCPLACQATCCTLSNRQPTQLQGLLGGGEETDEDEEESLGPWLALQQLVVKAFFQPETELLALQVLGALAEQVARCDAAAGRRTRGGTAGAAAAEDAAAVCDAAACGADLFSCLSLADGLLLAAPNGRPRPAPIEAVLGDLEAGVAISLGAALPWLCVHLRDVGPEGVVEGFLESTAGACTALGWPDLAAALTALAGMAGAAEEPEQWLPPLCTVRCAVISADWRFVEKPGLLLQAACAPQLVHPGASAYCPHSPCLPDRHPPARAVQALCGALFPRYARLVLQRLLEVVQASEPHWQ